MMNVYVTQILKDVEGNNNLDQTEISVFTDLQEAEDHLESRYEYFKYNDLEYNEKIKENEDYLDVDFCEKVGSMPESICDLEFRLTDGVRFYSGRILKKII